MKLKYVGPKPVVSNFGVDFDKSEPDRYIFLYAALEIMELIEGCITSSSCKIDEKSKIIDFSHFEGAIFNEEEMLDVVKKHCKDIEKIIKKKDERLEELLKELKQRVEENETLKPDDKEAWLGNIDIMYDYYVQFVENEVTFECVLDVLAEDIYNKKIEKITFGLNRNYGFVFSYLRNVLASHKPPIDSELKMEVKDSKPIGHFILKYPKKSEL